jgi:adenylate cyclase
MERRLAAILTADVVGYSRLVGIDEAGTLSALKAHREELIEPKIAEHNGRIVKLMGDGLLAEFPSAVEAVLCAVQIQHMMAERNAPVSEDHRISFRIGINIGDVVVEDDDIYGDGVNLAARLENLSEPGGICVRRNVRNQVRDKLDIEFEDLGELEVKNIARPVRAFRVVLDAKSAALVTPVIRKPPKPTRASWLTAAAGVVALIVVALALLWWQPWAPDVQPASVANMAFPLPEKPSIAVLPFENLGADPDQEYFVTGVTESIVTELSRFHNLFVIAQNSASTFKEKPVTIREVSEALGVQYVLTGTVQRSQDSIRINTKLIDALTGRHLWAERYDRDPADLFAVQDDVTKQIVATLATQEGLLADAWQERIERKGTDSLKAYELDLRGWVATKNWTKKEFSRADELFEQAIAADPGYARPYANLAMSIVWQVYSNFLPEEALDRAVELAKQAITRDDGEAWGHWALGAAYLKLGHFDQAIAEYEKALALNPNDADVLAETAFALAWVGRPEDGVANALAAIRLNPRHPDYYLWALGVAYYDARNYEQAAVTLASRKSPNLKSNLYLAAAYGQMGRSSEAKVVIDAILAENPDSSIELWGTAQPYRIESDMEHYIEGLRNAGLPEHPPLKLPDKPSIAVLAFDNLSGDPQQEVLSDAISDSIITGLSRFPELFVIARHSSFKYKGEAADVRLIGRELGVRYVLEGSMQRAGNRLRVNTQLIDATSGDHIWAEEFDRADEDIFALQDEMILSIVTALAIKVEEAERLRATRAPQASLNAYDLFLRARDLQLRKGFWIKKVNQEVRALLEQAISLSPEFARAYAELSWTHLFDFLFKWTDPPELSRQHALDLARKAVQLDPSSARAHYALGYVYLYQKEHALAAAEVEKALALNPNDARLRAGAAGLNIYEGDPERAIQQITEAMRLNPHHEDWYWHFLAWARFHAGKYDDALQAIKRVVSPSAGDHRVYAAILVRLGRLEEAASHVKEVLKRESDFVISHFRRSLPYKDADDADDYLEALALAGLPE